MKGSMINVQIRNNQMKIFVSIFLTLAVITAPLHADQIILAQLTHTTATDDEANIDFDLNGMDFRYMTFGDDGLYLGAALSVASAEDEVCDQTFCIDFEMKASATTLEVGYNFDNPFTPFVSLVRSNAEIDFGVTGMGIGDTSDSETNIGAGVWFGGEDRRLQLAFTGVDTEDPAVSLGGYTVVDNSLVLTAFIGTSTESAGDSWGLTIGVGWSF